LKNKLLFSFLTACLLCTPVFAHQPRFVGHETIVNVIDPEVSKAYYAEFYGYPVKYVIRSATPFKLYVNLLVPDRKFIKKDVSAKIINKGKVIALLDAKSSRWPSFYEEFAGDTYYKGPEYSQNVPAGEYELLVSRPGNTGKYVIAIGDKEAFPPAEILRALISLPFLKLYFGKSVLTAYFNKIGLFMSPVLLIVILIIAITVVLLKRKK